MTVYRMASRSIVVFRMAGSPPKRRFHRPQLSSTVPLAAGLSSLCARSRPSAGCTPSVRSRSHEIKALFSFSGNCPPDPESPTRIPCASARLL